MIAIGLSAGCAAEAGDDAPATGEEQDITALSLSFGSETALTDSPALKAGSTGALACTTRVSIGDKVRLTCARGAEDLEVILDAAAKKAVVIHRPAGRHVDKRTFFACTTSGNGPGDLPAKLACQSKAPTTAGGGLSSPFDSDVNGVDIPNAHVVGGNAKLLRGMAPRTDAEYAQLQAAGVGAVLVFKNQTGNAHDVADEITKLGTQGLPASRISNIPFKWKDLDGFEPSCSQTVEGLAFIDENLAAGKKTFFHCTVGEDRTGLLAAMHRLITEPALDPQTAFTEEMCERGYGAGNPLKPAFVIASLDKALTPLYRQLAWMVKQGTLSAGALAPSVCAPRPAPPTSFLPIADLHCGTSTRFSLH